MRHSSDRHILLRDHHKPPGHSYHKAPQPFAANAIGSFIRPAYSQQSDAELQTSYLHDIATQTITLTMGTRKMGCYNLSCPTNKDYSVSSLIRSASATAICGDARITTALTTSQQMLPPQFYARRNQRVLATSENRLAWTGLS